MLIDVRHPRLSVLRQCDLLGLPRSSLYYRAQGEDGYNQQLMRLIDMQYTSHPYFGVRRMTAVLRRDGHAVNDKRVRRLMRVMGLETIWPRPRTSLKNQGDAVYPYLLKDQSIDRPDQVWATDITYIALRRGWVYVAAVMDSLQPVRAELGDVDHAGQLVLCRCSEAGAGTGHAGDLQQRPGQPVHQPGVHERAARRRDPDQHGRRATCLRTISSSSACGGA